MKLIQVKAVTNNFQQTSLEIIWLWTSVHLWQYGLWSFQKGGTKLERFLPKNQLKSSFGQILVLN